VKAVVNMVNMCKNNRGKKEGQIEKSIVESDKNKLIKL
jgi:hypothetical protein